MNRNLALVIALFGLVGLVSSILSIGDVIFGKDPAQIFNPDQMKRVVDTAAWSSTFSIAAVGFGLYNWDKKLLVVFGAVGISFSILVVVLLIGLAFIRSFNNSGFINEFKRLITMIVYTNVLFIAAIIVGVRNLVRK